MRKLALLIATLLFLGCATPSKKTPEPRVSTPNIRTSPTVSRYSLWRENSVQARLFEDHRARQIGDILTVKILENSVSYEKAETKGSKASTAEGSISSLFRIPSSTLERFTHKMSVKRSSSGKGETSLSGRMVATITVQVVDVLPNGNLVIEGKKEMMINDDKTFLVLKGIVRPEDIDFNNSVLSTQVANAKIYYTGRGAAADYQRPNLLIRFLNLIDLLGHFIP